MKVKCVQASFEKTKGIFNKTKVEEPIEGLTEGKVYDANPVSLASGSVMAGIGDVETRVRFLIFNDADQWDTYQPELFTPVDT